jgi:hypothetical protein
VPCHSQNKFAENDAIRQNGVRNRFSAAGTWRGEKKLLKFYYTPRMCVPLVARRQHSTTLAAPSRLMLVGRSQPEKNAPPKNIIFASFSLPTQQKHTSSHCDCEQRANFRAARNPLSLKARRQKSLAAWHLENSEYVGSQILFAQIL